MILILAPHTDDGEWGAGGSIIKWKMGGAKIFHLALSDCRESVPSNLPGDILRKEFKKSNQIIGLNSSETQILDFPVRCFSSHRQDILECFISYRDKLQPDLIICPSSFDTHQDHAVVCQEAFRAFKRSSILGYEMPWNNRNIELSYYVPLEEHHVNLKQELINSYNSQIFRAPNFREIISGLATLRGSQINQTYAEAFEAIRVIEK